MTSHLLLLVIFAFFVSLVFAVIAKDEPREQLRFGAVLMAVFVLGGIAFAWVMYPFPL